MQDIVIQNGTICDGTGGRPFIGNVCIRDGKITDASPAKTESGKITIDATGKVISPGFIDMHSHSDTSFLADEKCESKILQGITTEVAGQCGSTVYPCPEDRTENLYRFVGENRGPAIRPYASPSFHAFLDTVKARGGRMPTILVPLIGHGALRAGVMGFAGRPAARREIEEMAGLLERDMESGAWGVSLGLGYAPGVFADQRELNALGRVVRKYDGIITSHMRNQGSESSTRWKKCMRFIAKPGRASISPT